MLRRRTRPTTDGPPARAAAARPARCAASSRRFLKVSCAPASAHAGRAGCAQARARAAARVLAGRGPHESLRVVRLPVVRIAPDGGRGRASASSAARGARRTTRGARSSPVARTARRVAASERETVSPQSPTRTARCASMSGVLGADDVPRAGRASTRHASPPAMPSPGRGLRRAPRGAQRRRRLPSARPPAANSHAVTDGISQSQSTPDRAAHAVATAASAAHAGARSRALATTARRERHERERSSASPRRPISPSVSRSREWPSMTYWRRGPVAQPEQRVGPRAGAVERLGAEAVPPARPSRPRCGRCCPAR